MDKKRRSYLKLVENERPAFGEHRYKCTICNGKTYAKKEDVEDLRRVACNGCEESFGLKSSNQGRRRVDLTGESINGFTFISKLSEPCGTTYYWKVKCDNCGHVTKATPTNIKRSVKKCTKCKRLERAAVISDNTSKRAARWEEIFARVEEKYKVETISDKRVKLTCKDCGSEKTINKSSLHKTTTKCIQCDVDKIVGRVVGDFRIIRSIGRYKYDVECVKCGFERTYTNIVSLGSKSSRHECKRCNPSYVKERSKKDPAEAVMGKTFGLFKAIGYNLHKQKPVVAECRVCKTVKEIGRRTFTAGTTPCDCQDYRYDAKGVSNTLVAIRYMRSTKTRDYWLCKCSECGKQREYNRSDFVKGEAKCLCQRRKSD